jgi:hypothetical protein
LMNLIGQAPAGRCLSTADRGLPLDRGLNPSRHQVPADADMGAWNVVGFPLLGSSPSASEGRVRMDDTTINTLDQTDEEILTYTVSDEALEAAAGTEAVRATYYPFGNCSLVASYC